MFGQSVNKISSFQQAQQYKPPTPPEYSDEDIIIKFRAGITIDLGSLQTSSPRINAILKKINTHKAEKLHQGKPGKNAEKANKVGVDRIFILKVPKGSNIIQIIDELKKNPEVEYAEPNYKVKATATPNDPSFLVQWGLNKINAPAAWDINTGSSSVVVAVIDTGIDRAHPDLAANIWQNTGEIPGNGIDDDGNGFIDDVYGWNCVGNNNNTFDDHKHGTHVAGIIGAIGNNGTGISGLNWNVRIMPIKNLASNGSGDDAWSVAAITYAADNGADILNLSWGGYYYSQALNDAINYAYSKGCVIVAAAGNDNVEAPLYPASFPNVISVGATDSSDQKAGFSNFGSFIDLVAPGVGIYSSVPGGGYSSEEGTSMAAPYVSGLAALLKVQKPVLDNEDISQYLSVTADDLGVPGWDKFTGYGRINAFKALSPGLPLRSRIISPSADTPVNGIINIIGTSDNVPTGTGFQKFSLEWGYGNDPITWYSNGISLTNGGMNPVMNGQLAQLDTSQIANEGLFTLRLSSVDDAGRTFYAYSRLYKNSWLLNTWPTNEGNWESISLYDINNDGKDEIIYGSYDGMFVKDSNGNDLPGWPITNISAKGSSVGDVNGDGAPEIVYKSGGTIFVRAANGAILPGWPVSVGVDNNMFPCTLSDINNDGKLEIITGSYWQNVNVLDYQGNALAGWPVALLPGYILSIGSADINNDGDKELIVQAGTPQANHKIRGSVYVLKKDGSILSGWPQTDNLECYGSAKNVAIGDIDGDLLPEIIAAHEHNVFAWKNDGSLMPGWPIAVGSSWDEDGVYGLSLADINNDGYPEILGSDWNWQYVWNRFGSSMPGWPKMAINSTSSIVGDVDGNKDVEVMSFDLSATWGGYTGDGDVHMYKKDGTMFPGWPQLSGVVKYDDMALGDVDGDKRTELVVMAKQPSNLYIFKLPGVYMPENNPWPTSYRDNQRTCFLPYLNATTPSGGAVRDGSGADIDFQSSTNTLSANWGGFIDPAIGINSIKRYDYAVGTTPNGTDLVPWTQAGLAMKYNLTGLSLIPNVRYFTSVRAYNNAGSYKEVCSNGVLVDTTSPVGTVRDGLGADIDFQPFAHTVSANWSIADPESGIAGYQYSIGKTSGGTDVLGWKGINTATYFTESSLSLMNGQTYFMNVRAVNNAGLSSVFSSNGIMINDNIPPVISNFRQIGNNFSFNLADAETGIDISSLYVRIHKINDPSGLNVRTFLWGSGNPNMTYEGSTGRVVVTPDLKNGEYTVMIFVQDLALNSASQTETISVVLPPERFNAYTFPNPFSLSRRAIKIRYEMPSDGKVTMQIFDTNGNLQKDLMSSQQQAGGIHEIEWDGRNSNGQKVNEAVYFCVIEVKDDSGKRSFKKLIKILVTK